MRVYKIKLVSQSNSVVLILIILAFVFITAFLFFPSGLNQTAAILVTIGYALMTYFLWQKFVTGRTEWTINEAGVSVKWIKQFAFRQQENISLKWSEIENMNEVPFDPNYYTLKIKLTTGEKMKFFHDVMTTGDDFKEFKKALYSSFREANSKSRS